MGTHLPLRLLDLAYLCITLCTSTAVLVQQSVFIIYFTRTHMLQLLADNDTVPISVCRGGGMFSTEGVLVW